MISIQKSIDNRYYQKSNQNETMPKHNREQLNLERKVKWHCKLYFIQILKFECELGFRFWLLISLRYWQVRYYISQSEKKQKDVNWSNITIYISINAKLASVVGW